jgi:hypothetical protein
MWWQLVEDDQSLINAD